MIEYCADCAEDTTPATHHLGSHDFDPLCSTCYHEQFMPCTYCGADVRHTEVLTVQTARQTWESPAEYEDYCEECLPAKYQEPDPERYQE